MRILTYNILDGGVNREPFILKTIEATNPDIVMLQEVFDSTPLEEFASNLKMHYFLARGNTQRHLAILSRYPIIEMKSYHPFPPSLKTTLYAKLEYRPNQFIHAFGLHLVPHPFILLELWRKWEKNIALSKAMSIQSEPCFLSGDFNAIAPGDLPKTLLWPRKLKLMLSLQGGRTFHFAIQDILNEGFIDCYREIHLSNQGYTLPVGSPTTRLDYIFANQLLCSRLNSSEVVVEPKETAEASDHYPLLAEFEI